MMTDIPISNIFIPRNDWYLKSLRCKKYVKDAYMGDYRYQLAKIISEVVEKTRVPLETFVSKTRYRPAVEARQIYFKRAREKTNASYSVIGSMVKNGDHANVMYGIQQVNTVPELIKKYNEMFNQ